MGNGSGWPGSEAQHRFGKELGKVSLSPAAPAPGDAAAGGRQAEAMRGRAGSCWRNGKR